MNALTTVYINYDPNNSEIAYADVLEWVIKALLISINCILYKLKL